MRVWDLALAETISIVPAYHPFDKEEVKKCALRTKHCIEGNYSQDIHHNLEGTLAVIVYR